MPALRRLLSRVFGVRKELEDEDTVKSRASTSGSKSKPRDGVAPKTREPAVGTSKSLTGNKSSPISRSTHGSYIKPTVEDGLESKLSTSDLRKKHASDDLPIVQSSTKRLQKKPEHDRGSVVVHSPEIRKSEGHSRKKKQRQEQQTPRPADGSPKKRDAGSRSQSQNVALQKTRIQTASKTRKKPTQNVRTGFRPDAGEESICKNFDAYLRLRQAALHNNGFFDDAYRQNGRLSSLANIRDVPLFPGLLVPRSCPLQDHDQMRAMAWLGATWRLDGPRKATRHAPRKGTRDEKVSPPRSGNGLVSDRPHPTANLQASRVAASKAPRHPRRTAGPILREPAQAGRGSASHSVYSSANYRYVRASTPLRSIKESFEEGSSFRGSEPSAAVHLPAPLRRSFDFAGEARKKLIDQDSSNRTFALFHNVYDQVAAVKPERRKVSASTDVFSTASRVSVQQDIKNRRPCPEEGPTVEECTAASMSRKTMTDPHQEIDQLGNKSEPWAYQWALEPLENQPCQMQRSYDAFTYFEPSEHQTTMTDSYGEADEQAMQFTIDDMSDEELDRILNEHYSSRRQHLSCIVCGGSKPAADFSAEPTNSGCEYLPETCLDCLSLHRDCIVCGDNKSTTGFPAKATSAACKHPPQTCADCLERWIASEVDTKGTAGITCPECPEALAYTDIQRAASPGTFTTYDKLIMRAALSAIPNFAWCLSCSCESGQVNHANSNFMDCLACGYQQCLSHRIPWHFDETCEQYDYRISGQKDRDERNKRRQEERQTESMLDSVSKTCPNPKGCGWRIEKTSGCDHMTSFPNLSIVCPVLDQ